MPPDDLAVSLFAVCELLAGAALAQRGDEERQKVREFCATLRIAYPDDAFADQYARIVGTLKRSGRNVGAMDLLIATAAVRDGARLVIASAGPRRQAIAAAPPKGRRSQSDKDQIAQPVS